MLYVFANRYFGLVISAVSVTQNPPVKNDARQYFPEGLNLTEFECSFGAE